MPDDDLHREQAHLTAARAGLARMRERTSRLDSSAAGDWVSQLVLESTKHQRMRALQDDPAVPLFFGRLDYAQDHPERGATFHIGRRHVTDDLGDPLVVDWRAPISQPFYRASAREPMGVRRRRRFGFRSGQVTALEDEQLATGRPDHGSAYSRLLEEEIERPRTGPMRDIVATIQPEQDVIVRAALPESVCVQGAPGTGKTAVGLHRAAYLLYAFRDQLARSGVLVVGPNASFLRYIGDVLPALGEIDAEQTTVEELTAATMARLDKRYAVRGSDPAPLATLKGDARMAEVISRAVWCSVVEPTEALVVPRGSRRWRVPAYQVAELLEELRTRGVRYGAARAMLAQRLAHAVLVRMEDAGESPDDRTQDSVARSRPVKQYVDQHWPAIDPGRLVHRLLTDPLVLAPAADGLLTDDEQELLLTSRLGRAAGSARWSLPDAVLVDEAADLVERTGSYGHVVLDEAQDLSPMMLRAVGRRCSTGSVTVLGDLAQATTAWATRSWAESLGHLGHGAAHVEELTEGFRVPGEVIDYAARLLPVIAPGLAPPTSVRRSRGELQVVRAADVVTGAVDHLQRRRELVGSLGVIAPDSLVGRLDEAFRLVEVEHGLLGRDENGRVDLVPASLVKGLEFDHVVLLEPEAIVGGEPDRVTGLRRLYVCLTRAVTTLVVLHQLDLPGELGAPRHDTG